MTCQSQVSECLCCYAAHQGPCTQSQRAHSRHRVNKKGYVPPKGVSLLKARQNTLPLPAPWDPDKSSLRR